MQWRRDVRRFRTDPVDEALLTACLESFRFAPSVGLSEPWRLIRIESAALKTAALENFKVANAAALQGYEGEKATLYSQLKLSGMENAPIHLAVFSDPEPVKGGGLGSRTMPQMLEYSAVGAVMQFWLMLRAYGLGLGWVSILDPNQLARDLDVPENWNLIGYFCIGWPEEVSDTPELMQAGWEERSGQQLVEVR